MAEKKIYVMLAKTSTSVSKMIAKSTKSRFTHSAIAFDRQLTEMYSFARRRPHNFLISGFIHENLDTGVYSWNMDAPCVLYEFTVSEEVYNKARDIIDSFMANYSKHKYNMIGLVAIKHGKVLERKYKYACSQFVAHTLLEAGIVSSLPKNKWLIEPDDLIDLEGAKLIYDGALRNVRDCDNVD